MLLHTMNQDISDERIGEYQISKILLIRGEGRGQIGGGIEVQPGRNLDWGWAMLESDVVTAIG